MTICRTLRQREFRRRCRGLTPVGLRRRVGTGDYSPEPLTEPYVRVTHTAPWIGMSEFQRELVRDLRRVEVVPQGFERDQPAGEPARWVSSRHRRAV
jgi:hypothetical protein